MTNLDDALAKSDMTGIEEAKRRIAAADIDLDLGGLKLTRVPAEIGKCFNLRRLTLSENRLTSLSPTICELTQLSALRLDNNQLMSLPQEIVQLTQLDRLVLANNKLTSFPPEIGCLVRLTELDLSRNQLTSLPCEVGRLTQLSKLHLQQNQLTSLPTKIGQLTQLCELWLNHNQLTSLPLEIGQLTQLTSLWLHKNQLRSLPKEIGQLVNLTQLALFHNVLASLPSEIGKLTNLELLWLHSNDLDSLPRSLRRLSKLNALFLHSNPKLKLPASVLGDSYEASQGLDGPNPGPIFDYYFRTRSSERRPLCEGKLILVGRGDVGKTSLVQRLVDNEFSRREDTTQGIRIRQWPIKVGRKKDEIRLHVWDFGGQEVMHATHQLFLTDRSLYLLVLDGRGGQQEAEADYWLRLISSFAPESPVLVVLNKIKKDHFSLNRGALQQKHPQVKGFIETDCDNPGSDKKPGKQGHGIAQLKKAIAEHVDKLPEIRQAFPASWFAIKENLQKPRQKNFLSIAEYRALCEKLGEPDEKSQYNLSIFLHRLGIALNFCDDPRLHDKHVLNPHWLTTGIYTLLNSKTLAARKGELKPADLKTELAAKQYPAEMHPFLINLMEKFELCFSFEEHPRAPEAKSKKPTVSTPLPLAARYLIPELLDPQQPPSAEKFDELKCLNFHYRYPVLPPGLLPRFIVRTHVLSEEHRWKTGVILNFEGNTALVKADPQEKIIRVLINGPTAGRRRMLAVIRQDFDVIHRDIPHLKPDELVSFPESPQITVSYAELEVLFNKDPDTPIHRVVEDHVISTTARKLLEGVGFAPINIGGAEMLPQRVGGRIMVSATFLSPEPFKLFFSYSRVDAKQRLKLDKHLAPLIRIGLIQTWCDNEILPGAEFEHEIANKLAEADIVLLLISPDFVASKYCYEIELQAAMERHQKQEVRVLPIIIRPTNSWAKLRAGELLLGSLNALPTSGKPIPKWKPQDDGWADIAAGVERAADELQKKRNYPRWMSDTTHSHGPFR